MCFSATASLSAAALLTGMVLLRLEMSSAALSAAGLYAAYFCTAAVDRRVFMASYATRRGPATSIHHPPAQLLFLCFAVLVWPIWVPLALALAESKPWHRRALWLMLMAGVAWDGFFVPSRWQTPTHVVVEGP